MTNREQQLPAVHEAWLPREHALHRPRHGGRQLTALISALVFFVTPALMWVFGARPGEIENHRLAGFPAVTEGWGLFTGLPAWATDHLVFRAGAIEAADAISRGLFGEPAPFDQGGDTGPLPGTPAPGTGGTGGTGGPSPSDSDAGYRRVLEGRDNWLYYGRDVEAKCEPTRPFAQTLQGIDRLRQAVEASGRRFVLTVAPDKTTMVPQNLPGSYAGKECSAAATSRLWQLIDEHTDAVDLRPALAELQARMGKPVYYPNDTHWMDEGALAMTRVLAEAVQPGITDSWVVEGDGWITAGADLPPMIGRSEQKTTIKYDLRPDGETDRTRDQLPHLEEPVHQTAPPMDGTVNDPALVLGDSFTLASSRYLPAAFSDLTILGYATMGEDLQAAVDAFVNADVVVVEVVERSMADGRLPFTDPAFIDKVGRAMAERPVR
ncbi:alginate O-acetyltransferase AlgX-related protein [Prauserella muralis]|uniref:AlgX/AlgJ SGNH hydrolase-like domain-containing protein n=1 Tax=Prauserella muralis TaxID=588067 RepID=A0A2V4B746_9PSEU|nr:hypothetical protein [Prauserella muralis]PXY31144.1 hypothetical protein BAY60_01650 [Prauserella muralis]TWE14563.1 acetyltransferase AlgX (SGNH hydrolase-like protein) [Prauserella muralis]